MMWMRVIEEDMSACGVNKNVISDREGRRERIRVFDFTCGGEDNEEEEVDDEEK